MKVYGTVAIALLLVSSLAMFASAEPKSPKAQYPIIYHVCLLPVWKTDGKETTFAPQVLVKYLQSTIDPQSWKDGAGIKVDEGRAGLVITQTKANHEAIAKALDEFRNRDAHETRERIKK